MLHSIILKKKATINVCASTPYP
ncbi:hypothetical protein EE612_059574 [Oryza sativa]|nr:hypothetical protein EE612_059574 [Oryza sativa]